MLRRLVHLLPVLLVLLAASAAPALAADSTFKKGETVSLGVGTIPDGYRVDWTSDRDGPLGSGNPLNISTLSVGVHTLTVDVIWTADGTNAYEGTTTVEVVDSGAAPAPSSDVAPGEFEQVQRLLLGCNDAYSVNDLYPQFLSALRGVVKTTIYADNDRVKLDLLDVFQQAGVADADFEIVVTPIDSIWIRDYGPLFVRRSGQLQIVDLDYYPNRPQDDVIPQTVGRQFSFVVNPLHLSWEGGNWTPDGHGDVFCTDRMLEENSGTAASDVLSAAGAAFAGRMTVLEQQLHDGGTGHLDMFCLLTGAQSAMVSRFPAGNDNHDRMDHNAQQLQAMGFNITRLDTADDNFMTYSNAVLINGVALITSFNNPATDQPALAAYQAAGYRTYAVDCRRIIQWAGAIHCITNTIPAQ
jgi:agmatine/peptidylarginine deiminase